MNDIMKFSKEDTAITSIADIQASQETINKLLGKIDITRFEIDRIRDIRLAELDIDWDEYKAHQEDTDFDTVITICEDILEILEG